MNYTLKTVFFSSHIISLFGEIHVYEHLPHGWCRYEEKTFCRVQKKLEEIKLWDLFPRTDQKEFLRQYCEDRLKTDPNSYFNGKEPLRTKLEYEDIRTFVVDDKSLIILFQPYTVGGLGDGPIHVKIPYKQLESHWNNMHPLPQLLHKALSSEAYTASWDGESDPSEASMYKTYASYYDRFYQSKDYEKESCFLDKIFSQNQIRTILDVGCGTGSHLSKLTQYGYACEGVDLNPEMVEIAKTKLHGKASQADMRTFNLGRKYDAVISMFAVFNHNMNLNDAQSTLSQFRDHLDEGGILILDLYNPQSSGQKEASVGGITKIMKWQLDPNTQICESVVTFVENGKATEEKFPLRVYSIPQITDLLKESGFKQIEFYDNYTFSEGLSSSKNLIVVAR